MYVQMMLKHVLTTAAILLTGQAYAQSLPTTGSAITTQKTTTATSREAASALKYIKDSFSASYHGEFYFQRRDAESTNLDERDIQDIRIMHSPTLIYNPTKQWQVVANGEFKYSNLDNEVAYPNTFYRALFMLTRKDLVIEKEHGFQLDAGIGRRQFNTGMAKIPSFGNNRIFATISKKVNKHSGSLFAQYLYNDYKKSGASTWEHAIELLPTVTFQLTDKLSWLINDDFIFNLPLNSTPRSYSTSHEMNLAYINYQWNDKIGTYYQFKYLHGDDFTEKGFSDSLLHYMGVSYAFTPKATLTGEIGSELTRSGDGRSFFSEKSQYPELALYVDLSI